jgi:diguanylate cyclase (GGDEF)-like protein/PAS domain S-box-containing protein
LPTATRQLETTGTAPTGAASLPLPADKAPLAERIPTAERLETPEAAGNVEPEEKTPPVVTRRDPYAARVAALLMLGGLVTLGVAGSAWNVLRQAADLKNAAFRRQTLLSAAARLDETLTGSARLYAATREDRYATRYQAAAAQIQEVLKELNEGAKPKTPEAAAVAEFAAASRARLSLERRAMEWVRAGREYEALNFLQSGGYERGRSEAAKAATQLNETAQRQMQATLSQQQNMAAFAGGGGLAALGLLGLSWRAVSQGRRRWRAEAVQNEIALQKTREELRQTRQQLDAKSRQLDFLTESKTTLELKLARRGEKVDRQLLLLEAAVESAKDVVMIAEADASMPRVVRVNRAFQEMTGYEAREIVGRSPKMLQGPDTDPETVEYLRERLRHQQPAQVELLNYRKDGTPFWVELNIQPIFNEKGQLTYWISVQRDVTERRKAAAKIAWQAKHDALTGLPNRTYYQEHLAAAIAEAEEKGGMVGVLFFDLDRFKQVNDTLGHIAGDRLLQEVAQRLESQLQGRDVIARVGGDEFTILLPALQNQQQAGIVAQGLLDSLDAPFHIEGQEFYVTASIGISIAPQDGKDISTLLKNADIAMYRAKEQGRDSFRLYNETMQKRVLDPFAIETQLRRAIERGELEEQLYLLYQPQVNLNTGKVFGVEALIRWENPQLGRVSPMQFIPVAEESGLIKPIGDWAMREACRQAARWRRQGRLLRMSVNLSARQFGDKELLANLRDILRETGLPADLLDIELTESTLAQGTTALETLNRLKGMGVFLSVDDFGTGYSSLSYLKNLPLDVLKIDKAFIHEMTEDFKSEALVRSLIALARSVGLEVIAEGVETEAQKAALMELGCHAIQGYLFSPPTTAPEIEKMTEGSPHLCLVTTMDGFTSTELPASDGAAARSATTLTVVEKPARKTRKKAA